MTTIDVLRLLVQHHDAKQFLTSEHQWAWREAERIVVEADATHEEISAMRSRPLPTDTDTWDAWTADGMQLPEKK